ncbi:MAG: branched-chain amino acid ABC transporter permease [Burkholderiaceae bacterium]
MTLLVGCFVAFAVASAFVGGGYTSNLILWIAVAMLSASSMRFVLLIGELNFATAAFYGIGAYSAGVAATTFEAPFVVALLAGGLVAAAVSALFGLVTLKTKGPYFLLIGFAFTEVMRLVYSRSNALGGNSGMVGIFPPAAIASWFSTVAVAIAGLVVIALYAIERSSLGKLFVAIRDNDQVVQSVGISVHGVKVTCFVIASFAAGIAGSLHAFANNVISPADFGFLLSTFALAYLKVGGEDSVFGPLAGAVLLVLLGSVAMGMGAGEHIFYGAAIVLAVLAMPKGVVGLIVALVRRVSGRRPQAAVARLSR